MDYGRPGVDPVYVTHGRGKVVAVVTVAIARDLAEALRTVRPELARALRECAAAAAEQANASRRDR